MPGQAGETRRQAAEGAAAARPQIANKPGHFGATHQGGAEEAGGGTTGGGQWRSLIKKKCSNLIIHKQVLT